MISDKTRRVFEQNSERYYAFIWPASELAQPHKPVIYLFVDCFCCSFIIRINMCRPSKSF